MIRMILYVLLLSVPMLLISIKMDLNARFVERHNNQFNTTMKKILLMLCVLLAGHWALAQRSAFANTAKETTTKLKAVATLKAGKYLLHTEALNKTTPAGYKISNFRLINSKEGKYHYLVQEVSSPKGKFNRFIPLKRDGESLYVNQERTGSFVDCWLMTCSTCEEDVSGTGMVHCVCSVGGCEKADTSDPVRTIVEKVFL